jgi:hypothetical protein
MLIDTPGFKDTKRTDKEVLDHIANYLSTQYKANQLLSGIIYLHPISSNRVQGSDMTQMRVFKELCGVDSYENVVLATTFWEGLEKAELEAREEELFSTESFLGDMKDLGAETTRVPRNDRIACRKLVKSFGKKQEVALKVQKDLAVAGATIDSTSAAAALLSEQMRQLELQQEREREEQQRRDAERQAKIDRQLQEAENRRRRELEQRLQREREAKAKLEREQAEEARRLEVIAERWRRENEQNRLEAARIERRMIAAQAEEKRRREELEIEEEAARERERQRQAEEARLRREQEAEQRRLRLIQHSRASLRAQREKTVCCPRYYC